MQCAPFLGAAAVQKQCSVVVKAAESVNPADIPESSFHRCFGFKDSVQLLILSSQRQRERKAPHWAPAA